MYEVLAESHDYLDDETGEFNIPDVIDGKEVMGFVDDWIVGGELDCVDGRSIEFTAPDGLDVRKWLEEMLCYSDEVVEQLKWLCAGLSPPGSAPPSVPVKRLAATVRVAAPEPPENESTLLLIPRNWRKIKAGKPLTIRGKRVHINADDRFRSTWTHWYFVGGIDGVLIVMIDDVFLFNGPLHDATITEFDYGKE